MDDIKFIPPRQFILLMYSRFIESLRNQLLSSTYFSKITPYSFQNYVALRVLCKKYPKFILGDEVGLGKTIEAGLILKELIIKRNFKKILILVPPNLKEQWIGELNEKFNLEILTGDSLTSKRILIEKFDHEGLKIFLFTHFDVRYKEITQALLEIQWDMIIVDEAHHVRRKGVGSNPDTTKFWHFMYNFSIKREKPKSILFLTATPMQLHQSEFFNLIRVLDPNLFENYLDFESNSAITQSLRKFSIFLYDIVKFREENENLSEIEINKFNRYFNKIKVQIPSLGNTIEDYINLNQIPMNVELIRKILQTLPQFHKISQILIRNKKNDLTEAFPELKSRNIIDLHIEMSSEFKDIYDSLQKYVEKRANDIEAKKMYRIKKGYIKATYEQLFASSHLALKKTLRNRIQKIEQNINEYETYTELETIFDDSAEIEEDYRLGLLKEEQADDDLFLIFKNISIDIDLDIDEVESEEESFSETPERKISEREFIQVLIKKIDKLGQEPSNDNKYAHLKELIKENKDKIQRFIIFVKFRITQKYLENRLSNDFPGFNFFKLNGDIPFPKRKKIITRFKKQKGILISTEVSGEGINLQFCNFLINYDLPWNPIKLEQRIGRIDRIGQKKIVFVRNLIYKDTISQRKYEKLSERYALHQKNIGELEPILKRDSELLDSEDDEIAVKDLIISNSSFNNSFWQEMKDIFSGFNERMVIAFLYYYCEEFRENLKIEEFLSEKYRNIYKISFLNQQIFIDFERYRNVKNLHPKPDGPMVTMRRLPNFSYDANNPNYYLITSLRDVYFKFGYSFAFLDHPLISFLKEDIMNNLNSEDLFYTTLELERANNERGFLVFFLVKGPLNYQKIHLIYISEDKNFDSEYEKELYNNLINNPTKMYIRNDIDLQTVLSEEEIQDLLDSCQERLESEIIKYETIFNMFSDYFKINFDKEDINLEFIPLGMAEIKPVLERTIKFDLISENFSFSQDLLSYQKLNFKFNFFSEFNDSNLYFEVLINSELVEIEFNSHNSKFLVLSPDCSEYVFSLVLPPIKHQMDTRIEFLLKNEYFTFQLIKKCLTVHFLIIKFYNHKREEKLTFLTDEIVFVKVTTIVPIKEIEIINFDKSIEHKLKNTISPDITLINEAHQSKNEYARDYIFKLEHTKPGIYYVRAEGELSRPFAILPNIEILLINNLYNLIVQPLEEVFFQINVKEENKLEILNNIKLTIYNKSFTSYGSIEHLENSLLDEKNFRVSLQKIFELLNPPIKERLNFREFIFEFSFNNSKLEQFNLVVFPEITFNIELGKDLIISDSDQFELKYKTDYDYDVQIYIELANLEDEYLTFSKRKVNLEVFPDESHCKINSNNLIPGVPYLIKAILKSNGDQLPHREETILVGKILFLKSYVLNLSDKNFKLSFLDSIKDNHRLKIKECKEKIEGRSNNKGIIKLIEEKLEQQKEIRRSISFNERLELVEKYFDKYNHIFLITQYDYIFNPTYPRLIHQFMKKKGESTKLNLLTYPCPTENFIFTDKDLDKIKSQDRRFFPIIRMRCKLCQNQSKFYFIYSNENNQGTYYCESCYTLVSKNINIHFENAEFYIPILNYISISCHLCGSPMITCFEPKSKTYLLVCENCGKRIRDVNTLFNKYSLGKNSATVISLNQLNYFLKRKILFPALSNSRLNEINQKIYKNENLENIFKFMFKNFPEDFNHKILDYSHFFQQKWQLEKFEEQITILNDFYSNLKRLFKLKKEKTKKDSKRGGQAPIADPGPIKKERFYHRIKKYFSKLLQKIKSKRKKEPSAKISLKIPQSKEKTVLNQDDDIKVAESRELEEQIKLFETNLKNLLNTDFGKELKLLETFQNTVNLDHEEDFDSYTKIIESVKFNYFNSEKFRELKQINELEKELIILKDDWKRQIFAKIIEIINLDDLDDLNADIMDLLELEEIDLDFSLQDEVVAEISINLDDERELLKISNNFLVFLKNNAFIDNNLKALNFEQNLKKLKNLNFKIAIGKVEMPKYLFIFDDINPDFKSNFSFNFVNFSELLLNLNSNIQELKNICQQMNEELNFLFFL